MEKLTQWVALTVVGILAILAAGWFLLVSPKKSEAAALQAEADTQLTANASLSTQLAVLKAQAKDLPKQQAKLAAVSAKIPENAALPALIRALDKAAASAGLELVRIDAAVPTAFRAAITAPVGAPVAQTSGGTAAPTTAKVPTAAGLQSIGLNISVAGGYFQVEQFLDSLESLTRALKVTGFTLVPGANPIKAGAGSSSSAIESGKSLTAAITALVFTTQPGATAGTAPVAGTTPAK